MAAVDHDSASYEAVMAAFRLPKENESDQLKRSQAIQEASKQAAAVPAETASRAAKVKGVINSLRGISAPQAASDFAATPCGMRFGAWKRPYFAFFLGGFSRSACIFLTRASRSASGFAASSFKAASRLLRTTSFTVRRRSGWFMPADS